MIEPTVLALRLRLMLTQQERALELEQALLNYIWLALHFHDAKFAVLNRLICPSTPVAPAARPSVQSDAHHAATHMQLHVRQQVGRDSVHLVPASV